MSTISAAHARILLVPLQLIPQAVALVEDVLFHNVTSIFLIIVRLLSFWALRPVSVPFQPVNPNGRTKYYAIDLAE